MGTVVFRATFNNFETVNLNQAWSLAFSGGQEDKMFEYPLSLETNLSNGFIQLEWGKMFTNASLAFSTIAIVWCIISSPTI